MNRSIYAFAVFLLAVVPVLSNALSRAASPEPPSLDGQDIIHKALTHGEDFIPKLTQSEREKYIAAIRELRPYDPGRSWNDPHNISWVFDALLRLGDVQTARWLIPQHHVGENGFSSDQHLLGTLSNWTSYEGYKFMGDLVCLDQEYKQPLGRLESPASFSAARLLVNQMIPNTYTFQKTVREWANESEQEWSKAYEIARETRERSLATHNEKVSEFFFTYKGREIARNWWKANEKAISEGRWGDVKRGESYMDEKFYQMIAQIDAMAKAAEPPAAPETSPIAKKPRLPAKPLASTPVKSPTEQAPSIAKSPAPTDGWLNWLLAATSLATAAGAVAIYRRKSPRKEG